jgi:transposase
MSHVYRHSIFIPSHPRSAATYCLIVTTKMNDDDPLTWLADVLSRIAGHPSQRLDELLPWNRKALAVAPPAKAA